jgi:hypothetical protein
MLSHKIDVKNYKPISYNITYDFETMNNTHVEKEQIKATKKENTLHLLSLAFTAMINFEVTNSFSYYLDDYESEEAMVYAFLDNMSSYAIRVMKSNKISLKDAKNKYQFTEVPIIGFNTSKIDMNLQVKYLSGGKYKIIFTLGKSIYDKSLKIETKKIFLENKFLT